jgi:hypothetical protein
MIIRDDLFAYFVGGLIGEGRGENEYDLVLRGATPLEDVLQHAR